jgi:SAM-dependent methyltransferase
MAILEPSEYDITYFNGKNTTHTHNAGYSEYQKWFRRQPTKYPEDTGEHFGDMAARLHGRYNLNNKKVMELGCAYGYMVEYLRDQGHDVYGMDVSSYAQSQARSDIQQYITVADARTELAKSQDYKRNEFDILFSRWFLCCIPDADLPDLIDEMNRVSIQQVHILMNSPNPDYYNVKTPQQWLDNYDWEVGTILIPNEDWDNYLTKIN